MNPNFALKFTEESNRAFAAAPDHMKRVMVALDGISAIQAQVLRPAGGDYVKPRAQFQTSIELGDQNRSVKDLIEDGSFLENCSLCAKGAVFALIVARRNQVTVGQLRSMLGRRGVGAWRDESFSKLLGDVFSPETLRAMEVEFEGLDYEGDGSWRAKMRMSTQLTPAQRLTLILRNIVDNDGEFVPVAPPASTVTDLYYFRKIPDWRQPSVDEWRQVEVTRGDLVREQGISTPIFRALKNRFRRWRDIQVSADLAAASMPVHVQHLVGASRSPYLDTLYPPKAAREWMSLAVALGQKEMPELRYGLRLPAYVVGPRRPRPVSGAPQQACAI